MSITVNTITTIRASTEAALISDTPAGTPVGTVGTVENTSSFYVLAGFDLDSSVWQKFNPDDQIGD